MLLLGVNLILGPKLYKRESLLNKHGLEKGFVLASQNSCFFFWFV